MGLTRRPLDRPSRSSGLAGMLYPGPHWVSGRVGADPVTLARPEGSEGGGAGGGGSEDWQKSVTQRARVRQKSALTRSLGTLNRRAARYFKFRHNAHSSKLIIC